MSKITWLQWFLAFAPAGVPLLLALPWLVYLFLHPPVLTQSTEAPAWAAQSLRNWGPCPGAKAQSLFFALTAIVLWVFGGQFINATTAALVVVSIMLLTGIVTWDDVVSNREAWKALTLLATLVTLSDGLYRTGLIGWFADYGCGSDDRVIAKSDDCRSRRRLLLVALLVRKSSLPTRRTAPSPISLSLGLEHAGNAFGSSL